MTFSQEHLLQVDQHFKAAQKAAQISKDPQLEIILRWLHIASRKKLWNNSEEASA